MKNVTEQEWNELLSLDKNAVIIDARTKKEWAEGVIENALMMDVMEPFQFDQMSQKLDKSKNYYVYCRSGQRSLKACALIETSGIRKTYNLVGGISGWTGKAVIPAQ